MVGVFVGVGVVVGFGVGFGVEVGINGSGVILKVHPLASIKVT